MSIEKLENIFTALSTCEAWSIQLLKIKTSKRTSTMNCTPFVRQYVILNNKWGALLCQKEYRTRDILQNSKKLL